MASNVVKNLARELNAPLRRIEEIWSAAKKVAEKQFKEGINDPNFFPTVIGITRQVARRKFKNAMKEILSGESVRNVAERTTLGTLDAVRLGHRHRGAFFCPKCNNTFEKGFASKRCPSCPEGQLRRIF